MSLLSAFNLLQNARRTFPSYVAKFSAARQTRDFSQRTEPTSSSEKEKEPDTKTPEGRWKLKSDEFRRKHKLTPNNAYSGLSIHH